MGAGMIAARDERRLGRRDLSHGLDDVLVAGDVRGIALRTDDDEVVVHDVEALHALAFRHELVLRGTVMHEDNVCVTPTSNIQRLTRADSDDLHGNAGSF